MAIYLTSMPGDNRKDLQATWHPPAHLL